MAALIAAVPMTINASGDDSPLGCSLTLPAQVRAGSSVPLTFELVNRGKTRLHVLTWNTPLEGWFGRFLRVTRDGQEIAYEGPQVKRGAPEAADYMTLRPHGRIRATVDLALPYQIKMPGRYEVAFEGRLHDVTQRISHKPMSPRDLDCGTATVAVVAAP